MTLKKQERTTKQKEKRELKSQKRAAKRTTPTDGPAAA
jgi:hypothetical protein